MVRGCSSINHQRGFLALCDDNLPTPAIADPGEHFKTVTYTADDNGHLLLVSDSNQI